MDLKATMGALSGNAAEDLKMLYNYVFQLTEEMRYLMNNLDVTNFNDLGLARYENGRLQFYSEMVEIRAQKVESVVEGLGSDLGEFENWTEGQLGEVRSSITQTAEQIRTEVNNTADGLQSYIDQNAEKIGLVVTKKYGDYVVNAAGILAGIREDENAYESFIEMSADAININGVVTFSDLEDEGKTVINANNIQTGKIRAIDFVASGNVEDDEVSNSFVIENGEGDKIGNIGFQYVDEDGYNCDKLWLITEGRWVGTKRFKPSIKIEAAGGVSIESVSGLGVYIYDGSGTEFMFKSGELARTIDGVTQYAVFE